MKKSSIYRDLGLNEKDPFDKQIISLIKSGELKVDKVEVKGTKHDDSKT